jgi:hypothetical protein
MGACLMDLAASARTAFQALPRGLQIAIRHRRGSYAPWETGRPPQAPPCPPGLHVGPPDFIGLGAPKCGTSWWFSLILAHPDVHGPIQKELLFFNRIFFRQYQEHGMSDEDLRTYWNWFPKPVGATTGEWTPSYLFWYLLPDLLQRVTPDVKLLVMLRDPIERYHSDISRRMPRKRLRYVRYRGLSRGFYSAEMEPWEDAYDRSRLLMLQYEACVADPATHLATTYRFLGLDDSYRPPKLLAKVNQTKAKRELEPGLQRLLGELYEPDVVRLAARYPEIDLRLWPHFAHLHKDGS